MDITTCRSQPGASMRRVALTAAAALGLSLLGLGGAAHAADVTVQPAPGAGFVVTDNTGASQRFKVLETGPIFLGGLVGSPPFENQALCYDTTTGQVGPCPSAKNLAFCVPNAAASPRFVDNLDGTLTDMTTCLMWETKTGTVGSAVDCSTTVCSDPHDVNNRYQWCSGTFPNCTNASNPPDGGVFTDFLPRVNGQLCASSTCPGLGGHSDWRVPTLSELQTIVDLTQGFCGAGSGPCINPAFGPTVASFYWSSATFAGNPSGAWFVSFFFGDSGTNFKASSFYVRAVRGGL
jgi:Protein of unknown function (DUF1566)